MPTASMTRRRSMAGSTAPWNLSAPCLESDLFTHNDTKSHVDGTTKRHEAREKQTNAFVCFVSFRGSSAAQLPPNLAADERIDHDGGGELDTLGAGGEVLADVVGGRDSAAADDPGGQALFADEPGETADL